MDFTLTTLFLSCCNLTTESVIKVLSGKEVIYCGNYEDMPAYIASYHVDAFNINESNLDVCVRG